MRSGEFAMVMWITLMCVGAQSDTVFDERPSNVWSFANEIVNFSCSVRGEGDILWYVNNTFAIALPRKLNARFETTLRRNGNDRTLGEASILKFIAKPEMNNSRIECAVGLNRRITNYRASAMLYVVPDVKYAVPSIAAVRSNDAARDKTNGAVPNKCFLLGVIGLVINSLLNGLH